MSCVRAAPASQRSRTHMFLQTTQCLKLGHIRSTVIFVLLFNLFNKILPSAEKNYPSCALILLLYLFVLPCMLSCEHTFLFFLFIQKQYSGLFTFVSPTAHFTVCIAYEGM